MGKLPTSVSNDRSLRQELQGLLAALDLTLPDLLDLADAKNRAGESADKFDIHKLVRRIRGDHTDAPEQTSFRSQVNGLRGLDDIPMPPEILRGLLPAGATLLAGPFKSGKSLLALYLAMAVAAGGSALDHEAERAGRVLYVAADDHPAILRARTKMIDPIEDEEIDRNFWVWTRGEGPRLPRVDEGLLQELTRLADEDRQTTPLSLVVLDTLRHVKPPSKRNEGLYEQDYDYVNALSTWGQKEGVAVLIVHHTNKSKVDDPMDKISGTSGLGAGGVANWVLMKDSIPKEAPPGPTTGTLEITSSVHGAKSLALQFDYPLWTLADPPCREMSAEAADFLAAMGGETWAPADLAEAMGKHISSVKMMLKRLVGRGYVNRVDRGLYQRVDV